MIEPYNGVFRVYVTTLGIEPGTITLGSRDSTTRLSVLIHIQCVLNEVFVLPNTYTKMYFFSSGEGVHVLCAVQPTVPAYH